LTSVLLMHRDYGFEGQAFYDMATNDRVTVFVPIFQ